MRGSFSDDLLGPIAGLLDGPEAELRASLSLAVLMGTMILETIMAVEPLRACDCEPVRRRLVRILTAALATDPDASSTE